MPKCIDKQHQGPRELPGTSFHKNRSNASGLQSKCKECQARANKERRAALRERHLKQEAMDASGPCPPPEPDESPSTTLAADPELDITVVLEAPHALPLQLPVDAPAPSAPPPTREQLLIARLRKEASDAKAHARELEKLALTGEAMRELVGTLGSPNIVTDPEWLRGASEKRSVTGTAVLFISDIHFDEVVEPTQVGGANAYNREIAEQSIRNTFRSGIVLLKAFMASPKYDGIVVPLGGDLLSGNIHEELEKTNEAPIQQSMLRLEELLIEGLGGLADEFGKVHVPCVIGNHGRMSRKPVAKNRAFESFEWPIYMRLAAYFRNDSRLTFDIPDGADAFFNIYGTRFCLTHGDQFRGGDGVGGILVPIMRGVSRKQFRQTAMGDPFDVLMCGHWHTLVQLSNLIINGSIKGMDEYAYQGNFQFQEPEQALFVVHPELGVTARWPIKCRHEGGRARALRESKGK